MTAVKMQLPCGELHFYVVMFLCFPIMILLQALFHWLSLSYNHMLHHIRWG